MSQTTESNQRKMCLKMLDLMQEQVAWIEQHGETLEGYVKRYGSKDDAEHYGDGGEAIYEADYAELSRLHRIYQQFCKQS